MQEIVWASIKCQCLFFFHFSKKKGLECRIQKNVRFVYISHLLMCSWFFFLSVLHQHLSASSLVFHYMA